MECVECGDDYSPKRYELGYLTCLECGDKEATRQIIRKAKCTAPAYNKGAICISLAPAWRGRRDVEFSGGHTNSVGTDILQSSHGEVFRKNKIKSS